MASSTCVLLTQENLDQFCSTQPSVESTRAFLLDRYHASLNPSPASSLSSSSASSSSTYMIKRKKKKNNAAITQNVAIDALPLPFPYHNDDVFMPVAEMDQASLMSHSIRDRRNSVGGGAWWSTSPPPSPLLPPPRASSAPPVYEKDKKKRWWKRIARPLKQLKRSMPL